jgi:tetratricopeptide (TPR) repeat protein
VQHLAEALALARGLAEPRLLCLVLVRFAHVHLHHNDMEAAASLASEALDVGRPQGDSVELGYALMLRAHVHSNAQEYEAAMRAYYEALCVRERMDNASGMVAAHLSLARLLVDQGRPVVAKSHLDRAFALVARADSHYEGLGLISMTAEWAAATGRPAVAVLLRAASDKQFAKAGFTFGALPRGGAERIERARLALSGDLAQQLAVAGGGLDYEQSLQRVGVFLSEPDDSISFSDHFGDGTAGVLAAQ